jgi:thiol-disulfide isomerase/thioredoxin
MNPADDADRALIRRIVGFAFVVRWLVAAGFVATLFFAIPDAMAASLQPWMSTATPILRFETVEGKPVEPARFAGKTVVLAFWATWCEPCRKELPALERLARELKGKQQELVLVNLGDSPTAIEKTLTRAGVSLPSLRVAAADLASNAWRVDALPAAVVISADGQARWRLRGSIDAQGEPLRSLALARPATP